MPSRPPYYATKNGGRDVHESVGPMAQRLSPRPLIPKIGLLVGWDGGVAPGNRAPRHGIPGEATRAAGSFISIHPEFGAADRGVG